MLVKGPRSVDKLRAKEHHPPAAVLPLLSILTERILMRRSPLSSGKSTKSRWELFLPRVRSASREPSLNTMVSPRFSFSTGIHGTYPASATTITTPTVMGKGSILQRIPQGAFPLARRPSAEMEAIVLVGTEAAHARTTAGWITGYNEAMQRPSF